MIEVWSEDLQCHWLRWEAFGDGCLRLYLPAGSCCDMRGAIRIGRAIYPKVASIQTFSGDRIGTLYSRVSKTEWEAYDRGAFHPDRINRR